MRTAQKIALAVAVAVTAQVVLGFLSYVAGAAHRDSDSKGSAGRQTPRKSSFRPACSRPRIAESLRKAGVRLAESYAEADYILNVNVGRRHKQPGRDRLRGQQQHCVHPRW